MWLMTKVGYFSVSTNVYGAVGGIAIRGRVREDLLALKEMMGWTDVQAPLVDTPTADYPYRLIVSFGNWLSACVALGSGVDYPKFKPVVKAVNPRRESTYLNVWALLQRELTDEDAG